MKSEFTVSPMKLYDNQDILTNKLAKSFQVSPFFRNEQKSVSTRLYSSYQSPKKQNSLNGSPVRRSLELEESFYEKRSYRKQKVFSQLKSKKLIQLNKSNNLMRQQIQTIKEQARIQLEKLYPARNQTSTPQPNLKKVRKHAKRPRASLSPVKTRKTLRIDRIQGEQIVEPLGRYCKVCADSKLPLKLYGKDRKVDTKFEGFLRSVKRWYK